MTLETKGYTYSEKVALGRQLAELILQKYGKKTLAVMIWGPGAVDDPTWNYPCLDILAVVRNGVRASSKEYVYRGLPVSVSYWKETNLLQSCKEIGPSWPRWAVWYRKRFVLYERNNWLRNLEAAIAENDKADSTKAIRATAWGITRTLANLKNRNPRVISADLIWQCLDLADDAQKLVYLKERRYPEHFLWSDSVEMQAQPPSFRSFTNFVEGVNPEFKEGLKKETERICEEVLAIARASGVSLESNNLQV